MRLEARAGLLGRLLGIFIATATLAGCGGSSSSSDAASSIASASSSSGVSTSSATALVALSASEYTVAPSSSAVVVINRSGSSKGAATVGYSTINGTATAGVDYAATSGSVSWQDGESGAKIVHVPVMGAAKGKNFGFALTSVAGQADFGSPAAATVGVSSAATSSSSSSSGGSSSSSSSSSGASSGGTAATSSVTLSWSAPTQNTDGTPLTNLAGFDIYYGKSASAMTNKVTITNTSLLTYVVSNLGAGTWFFEILAVNAMGAESNPSGVASTTIS
jgi:hypothetical protein